MKDFLGITPENASLGCLQDIHWSTGSFGYFPTYALGNLYAAQLFEAFSKSHPDWERKIEQKNLLFIRDWLREHVHRKGRLLEPKQLIEEVSGQPFSEKPFINHLYSKYQKIYPI
jgi:carboxypeptidase Taq